MLVGKPAGMVGADVQHAHDLAADTSGTTTSEPSAGRLISGARIVPESSTMIACPALTQSPVMPASIGWRSPRTHRRQSQPERRRQSRRRRPQQQTAALTPNQLAGLLQQRAHPGIGILSSIAARVIRSRACSRRTTLCASSRVSSLLVGGRPGLAGS